MPITGDAFGVADALPGIANAALPDSPNGPPGALNDRQRELSWRWGFYRCQNYDARAVNWNGERIAGQLEQEQIATEGMLPPGFIDPSGSDLPIAFRRPSAPYYLARLIVNRFTGLLFSSRRHPRVSVLGDEDTEAWVNAAIEVGRLWAQMIQARTFGGAMGSVAIGFGFYNGVPKFEVHDPRWCSPSFADPQTQELEALEVRYAYPMQVRNARTGAWEEQWFWYRRLIDEQQDVVWAKVPVGDGEEPAWDKYKHREAVHAFGFCPVVWVQNLPVASAVDGDPDCHGCYDTIQAVDALVSQANRGILSNCDPTLVISTDAELDGLSKGSGNAIKVGKGESAQYLEIDGKGPEAANTMADRLEERALKMAQCVLDQPRSTVEKTATESNHDQDAMHEKADVLQEQYGELGVKKVLEMMLRAARKVLGRTTQDPATGATVRDVIELPPKLERNPDTGEKTLTQHKLGSGGVLALTWPPYTEPTLDDVTKAGRAAADALEAGLIDDEVAVPFVAPYFRVEDPTALLARIRSRRAKEKQAALDEAQAQMESFTEAPDTEEAAPAESEPAKIVAFEADDGIFTVNEIREAKGYGPILSPDGGLDPDGFLTVPAYKAKHPEWFPDETGGVPGERPSTAAPLWEQK